MFRRRGNELYSKAGEADFASLSRCCQAISSPIDGFVYGFYRCFHDVCRLEQARDMGRDADPFTNLRGVQESVKLYQSAMVEYGKEDGARIISRSKGGR